MDSVIKLGFVGLGNMGIGMAANLQKYVSLHRLPALVVYNRTADKAKPLLSEGATLAPSLDSLADSCNVVWTMLTNDEALEVVFGKLTCKLRPGTVFIDSSTVRPKTTKCLTNKAQSLGISYLAAPVRGRPQAAAAAQLLVMVAGESKLKQTLTPFFNAIGTQILDLGDDPSKASAAKLVINFTGTALLEVMAETFAFGEKCGIATDTVKELLAFMIPTPNATSSAAKMATQSYDGSQGAPVSMGIKDNQFIHELASEIVCPLPLADLVLQRFLALKATKHEDWDVCGVAQLARGNAGLLKRSSDIS